MRSYKMLAHIMVCLFLLALCGCAAKSASDAALVNHVNPGKTDAAEPETKQASAQKDAPAEDVLCVKIDEQPVAVSWEQNASVEALRELVLDVPIEISMSMYGGFEQVGAIGANLVRNDEPMRTEAGDIVLYSGNQIVVFYGSNTWSYTPLGHITDQNAEALRTLLGSGDVTLTICMEPGG